MPTPALAPIIMPDLSLRALGLLPELLGSESDYSVLDDNEHDCAPEPLGFEDTDTDTESSDFRPVPAR
jgi:hypothetical protein